MLPNANQRFSQRKKEISLNYLEKQQSDLNNIHSFPSSLEDQASCFSGASERSRNVNELDLFNKTNHTDSVYEVLSPRIRKKRRRADSPVIDNESEQTTVPPKSKRRPPSQSTFSLSTVKKRGLKLMTLTICDAIQGHGSTTYAQLAQDLALVLGIPLSASSELKNDPNMAILEKNIRRRVYDCLNVLIATGIIEKTDGGRYLKWIGKMNFSSDQDPNTSSNVHSTNRETFSETATYHKTCVNEQLLSQLEQKKRAIQEKRENLELLRRQESAFQRLIDRNNKLSQRCYDQDSKIELPFILVRTPPSCEIFLETTEDQTMMKFKFTELFYLHGDAEVVTGLESIQTSPTWTASLEGHHTTPLKVKESWFPSDKENLPNCTANAYQLST